MPIALERDLKECLAKIKNSSIKNITGGEPSLVSDLNQYSATKQFNKLQHSTEL